MKTTLLTLCILFVGMTSINAQDRTTVRANSIDISDNLDLRAVAHIFGEASNLEDFERRLNDPSNPISNLDLNNDNQVDYLRVIEVVENGTHLIIVQSVLGRDMFQDVATVEVERDRNNNVQVQVVGDVYMYGSNYIYEPIYIHRPIIFNTFWVHSYRPYYSSWYWGYYPTYYYAWNPWPIFRYRNHVNVFVNVNNTCHYVNHRRSTRAIAMHQTRRSNYYETQHPTRSFSNRNNGVNNRYELAQARSTRNQGNSVGSTRNNQLSETSYTGTRNNGVRANANQGSTRVQNNSSTRSNDMAINTPRNSVSTPRNNTKSSEIRNSNSVSIENPTPRVRNNSSSQSSISNTPRNSYSSSNVPKVQSTPRSSSSQISMPRSTSMPKVQSTPRSSSSQMSSPRSNSAPKVQSAPRSSSSQMSAPTRSSSRSVSSGTRGSSNSARRG